jgi:SAM-dependent methyltransferase
MVQEARSAGSGLYAQADAQLLPLPDGCAERIMANHMLFHVPDQERALREMRRVLAPGGRVVLTTNGVEFMQRFQDLHDKAARHFDYTPDGGVGQRFTMDDLGLVRSVVPTAQREVLAGSLVFPTVESALRYYAAGMVDRVVDVPADRQHHTQLVPFMAEQVQAVIAAEGVFRVAKTVGWFFATV